MSRKLIVNDGQTERQMLLVANLVVGRDPLCDISGDNSLLSRRHAEFVIRGADVLVRDLGSRNGVYVNGARTAEEQLRSGDSLRIGHLQFQYVEDATPLTSALAAAAADATSMIPNAQTFTSDLSAAGRAAEEEDRTRFVPGPARHPAAAAVIAPPTPAATATDEEEEFTRVVAPPRPSASVVRADTLVGAPDEEERTRLVRPPTVMEPSRVSAATPEPEEMTHLVRGPQPQATMFVPMPSMPRKTEAPVLDGAWRSFVFTQLAVLVVVVAAAIAAPFQLAPGNTTIPLGVSIVVVLVATYVIGTRIVSRANVSSDRTEGR